MKLLLYAVVLFFLVTTAVAQRAEIVVSVNGGDNCITVLGENGFNATSYSLGGTEQNGGVGPKIAPALADLTITKNFDSCSEFLISMFLASARFPSVTLIQYQDNVDQTAHYAALTIALTDGEIDSYKVTGAASVLPKESLAFHYRKVCVTSITQRPNGSLEAPVRVCYDVARNQVN